VTVNTHPYKVDSEVGRFEFTTHSVSHGDEILYNTGQDLFAELKAKELYRTIGFKEIAMIYGDTEESYRKTTSLINRIRYQAEGGTPYRTLQENTAQEGRKLIEYVERTSKCILQQNGFSEDGVYLGHKVPDAENQAVRLSNEIVAKAVEKCTGDLSIRDEILNNPVPYEDPENTVNISIDDVNVKKQKEARKEPCGSENTKCKYVHNSVVHVAKGDKSYTLNGHGIKAVLGYLMAFIFHNSLIGYRFQFFTDGHKTLIELILKCFSWYRNIGLILDWYHLEKKCKERLSLAMKGRVLRNKVLEQLMPLLWYGRTDQAIDLLKQIKVKSIKSKTDLQKLIDYLKRNKVYIPCYAVRKILGLRNSSNIGEKMNDLVVSDRQKHNGMSWSNIGSVALASISSLKRNREIRTWFEKGEVYFKLAA
jgi:hypothetical protein